MSDRHFSLEEEFHAKDRKQYRKQRKIASRKDRSKFKKTDQDQLKKRTQPAPDNLLRGRVLAISPEGILVDANDKLFTCTLKGALKKERGRVKNLIAVGDFVHIDPQGEKEGSIAYIEERKSILSRAENHMRQMEQLIAVNIDQVLITTSVTSPQFKPFLIDRYIIAAKKGNMTPLIVINKIDLLNSASEEEKAQYLHFIEVYRNLGFSIFPVSVVTGEGIAELKEVMQGKASVFSGQSGVGKSSLINALTGSSLRIGEIVAKTSKGSHTTTTTHLIPLEGDAFCIDTPGIKSFGLWELTRTDIQNYFSEIHQIGKKCHYPDCSHLQEPDCAVQKAVAKGKISPLRFDSYSALMATLSLKHLPR